MTEICNQVSSYPSCLSGKRAPGGEWIVTFGYYDGPESGLIIYPSGSGIRFSSLEDSRSRLFRAFELAQIEGNWWDALRSIPQIGLSSKSVWVKVPESSYVALHELERKVVSATAVKYYLGVGCASFECLAVIPSSREQLDTIVHLDGSPQAFRLAHNILKHGFVSK